MEKNMDNEMETGEYRPPFVDKRWLWVSYNKIDPHLPDLKFSWAFEKDRTRFCGKTRLRAFNPKPKTLGAGFLF